MPDTLLKKKPYHYMVCRRKVPIKRRKRKRLRACLPRVDNPAAPQHNMLRRPLPLSFVPGCTTLQRALPRISPAQDSVQPFLTPKPYLLRVSPGTGVTVITRVGEIARYFSWEKPSVSPLFGRGRGGELLVAKPSQAAWEIRVMPSRDHTNGCLALPSPSAPRLTAGVHPSASQRARALGKPNHGRPASQGAL